jgi:hypothetical protein
VRFQRGSVVAAMISFGQQRADIAEGDLAGADSNHPDTVMGTALSFPDAQRRRRKRQTDRL